jgi:hypothetical protein
MKFNDIHIAIISHKRPKNVELMEALTDCGQELHWYVGMDEEEHYRHAKGMVIGGGNLIASRNMALNYAANEKKYCLMLDDDLVKIHFFTLLGQEEIQFFELVQEMYNVLKSVPLYLAGVASTTNRFFYNPKSPLGLKHFIGGWCTLTKKGSIPRYDDNLKTKEDYDITLEHVKQYGGVCRINYLAPEFKHWNNPGGVVDYRTDEGEQASIKYLKKKWKGSIRDNVKRPNEILLKL